MIIANIKKGKKEVNNFPKLMKVKTSNSVLLFTSPKVGTVLVKDTDWEVGHYSQNWYPDCFEDFTGELILKSKMNHE
jgi:hypothetical protein